MENDEKRQVVSLWKIIRALQIEPDGELLSLRYSESFKMFYISHKSKKILYFWMVREFKNAWIFWQSQHPISSHDAERINGIKKSDFWTTIS